MEIWGHLLAPWRSMFLRCGEALTTSWPGCMGLSSVRGRENALFSSRSGAGTGQNRAKKGRSGVRNGPSACPKWSLSQGDDPAGAGRSSMLHPPCSTARFLCYELRRPAQPLLTGQFSHSPETVQTQGGHSRKQSQLAWVCLYLQTHGEHAGATRQEQVSFDRPQSRSIQ